MGATISIGRQIFMSQVATLPLFPLHVVLFPGLPLPLHIFEPRYRLMVGRCLEASSAFGVVLIRAGREVGEPATPYSVGTTAPIVRHERLALLELTWTAERLRALITCVDREARLRGHVGSTRPASPGMLGDLSPN